MAVFWVVAPFSLFEDYMTQQSRWQPSSYSSPWEHEISQHDTGLAPSVTIAKRLLLSCPSVRLQKQSAPKERTLIKLSILDDGNSIPDRVGILLFTTVPTWTLRPTQTLTRWAAVRASRILNGAVRKHADNCTKTSRNWIFLHQTLPSYIFCM
jgi:hypothetical protein